MFESWAWIGSFNINGVWRWDDGTAWDYAHWFITEPNGEGPCALIFKAGGGTWGDMDCYNREKAKKYVCQMFRK
jgi:hypothetical protein